MRILIGCEFSGIAANAFAAKGHDVWSCDLVKSWANYPQHFQGDVRYLLDGWQPSDGLYLPDKYEYIIKKKHALMRPRIHPQWDLLVAFPPCCHLASSGAKHFAKKRANGSQEKSIKFFMSMINAGIEKICVENPVGIMSRLYRKPDQIIQPWQFGHGEQKLTCLWLKNLPLLIPTDIVEGREQKVWKMGGFNNRARKRAITPEGVASAMAAQWG